MVLSLGYFPFIIYIFCIKYMQFQIASASGFPLLKCKRVSSNSTLQFSNGSSQSDLQALMTVL